MGTELPAGHRLPLDWFSDDQQQHLVAHWMRNLPTMMVLAERCTHRNVRLSMQCPLCNSGPETARHLWECPLQTHESAVPAHVANHLHRATSVTSARPNYGTPRSSSIGRRPLRHDP